MFAWVPSAARENATLVSCSPTCRNKSVRLSIIHIHRLVELDVTVRFSGYIHVIFELLDDAVDVEPVIEPMFAIAANLSVAIFL